MLPEGTPGKYILGALRNGRMVKHDCCATREEMAALSAQWEAEGCTVLVEESRSTNAARSASAWANRPGLPDVSYGAL